MKIIIYIYILNVRTRSHTHTRTRQHSFTDSCSCYSEIHICNLLSVPLVKSQSNVFHCILASVLYRMLSAEAQWSWSYDAWRWCRRRLTDYHRRCGTFGRFNTYIRNGRWGRLRIGGHQCSGRTAEITPWWIQWTSVHLLQTCLQVKGERGFKWRCSQLIMGSQWELRCTRLNAER